MRASFLKNLKPDNLGKLLQNSPRISGFEMGYTDGVIFYKAGFRVFLWI